MDVVLEKLHGCENIEHCALRHPLRKREELCWNDIILSWPPVSFGLVGTHMNDTLSRNGKVFSMELLFVMDNFQIIGSELVWSDGASVSVEELDGCCVSMLRKE